MKAKIYLQSANAMQSGQKQPQWLLEFAPSAPLFIDPLMGWTGMTDTLQEVRLRFDTQEAAQEYASRNHIPFEVAEPKELKKRIKPKSYTANFAYNRIA